MPDTNDFDFQCAQEDWNATLDPHVLGSYNTDFDARVFRQVSLISRVGIQIPTMFQQL